ncbi:carbonic anhydrase 6 [Vipera latastei]
MRTSVWVLQLCFLHLSSSDILDWTYHGEHSEDEWGTYYEHCLGKLQSPINIQRSKVRFNPDLEPLQLQDYGYRRDAFKMTNNGHSVIIHLPSSMRIIKGLPGKFTAIQLHLHWGGTEKESSGSEHTIDGLRYMAELLFYSILLLFFYCISLFYYSILFLFLFYSILCFCISLFYSPPRGLPCPFFTPSFFTPQLHIVHYNSEAYSSFDAAKDKPDGLAVLAFLFMVRHSTTHLCAGSQFENAYYSDFIAKLAKVKYAGHSTTLDSLDVLAMLPENLSNFYRYHGSLTTPPCTENVIWTVFDTPIKLSYTQIDLLETTLLDWKNQTLRNDYRQIQPLNKRVVKASFSPRLVEGTQQE